MGRTRVLILIGTFVAIAVLFLFLRPGDGADGGSPTPTASASATASVSPSTGSPTPSVQGQVVEVTIAEGTVDAPDEIEIAVGETLVIRVASDIADEVHVHGYDLTFDLVAGQVTEFSFVADAPGIFEVETHDTELLLFNFSVVP